MMASVKSCEGCLGYYPAREVLVEKPEAGACEVGVTLQKDKYSGKVTPHPDAVFVCQRAAFMRLKPGEPFPKQIRK